MTIRLNRIEQDYRDAKNHVYGLAHSVCINGKEQRDLIYFLSKMEETAIKEGTTGERIIQAMISVIYDGLAYGNWPWVKPINVIERLQNK